MLCSAIIQSLLLRWVIHNVLIHIILIYNCVSIFSSILHGRVIVILFLLYYILNCHGTFLFSQRLNLFFCGIFEHNCVALSKEIHYFWFSIITNKCRNQESVTQNKRPLKDGALLGLVWSGWRISWLRHKLPDFSYSL